MSYKKVVVKIGSSVLTEGGKFSIKYVSLICQEIASLTKEKKIIIVSSGAILLGSQKLNIKHLVDIPTKQAAAAVGQSLLMNLYQRFFAPFKLKVAQVLLTHQDFSCKKSYFNLLNTFSKLLELERVIVIANENDSVAVEEIKFGDNDKLAAAVSLLVGAEILILLTDVDGIKDEEGRVIKEIKDIERVKSYAGGIGGRMRRGGMKSKLEAAAMVTEHGSYVVIANGKRRGILRDIFEQKTGSWIYPKSKRLNPKRRWLLMLPQRGEIIIDEGARKALIEQKKSLLPAGVVDVVGNFSEGEAVILKSFVGEKLAKGIVNYSSLDILKIKGKKSSLIERILGYKYHDEVVHRDSMVIL